MFVEAADVTDVWLRSWSQVSVTASLCFRYIHDDSETTEDIVGLKVSDGLNSVDVVLHVQVNLLNKGVTCWALKGFYWHVTSEEEADYKSSGATVGGMLRH